MEKRTGPLTPAGLAARFAGSPDYTIKEVREGGKLRLTLVALSGMVRFDWVEEQVLRPLRETGWEEPVRETLAGHLEGHGIEGTEEAVAALTGGWCLVFLPEGGQPLALYAGAEAQRSVSPPENETVLKGARDGFVESLRVNRTLVRTHLKTPDLHIREEQVGRRTRTGVEVLWVEGIADPGTVRAVTEKLEEMDVDGLLTPAGLEEYLTPCHRTAFPLSDHTERPDRFCGGLIGGQVGLLVDGLPLGYLVPVTVGDFFRAPQDREGGWMSASVLKLLRYLCLFLTLLLPALYIAVATFHQEMIPTRLALSIIAARRDVPFRTGFEVLLLLTAFEILQEAGLRLPRSVGQTVSIIGGLVVGQAAVEAKLVSPAVLIAVAVAGVAGYTMPSQETAGALRLWRFLLSVLATFAGLFGVVWGAGLLVVHLAGLESFGVPYLTPFSGLGGRRGLCRALIRPPLPVMKLRDRWLHPRDRRRQR